MVILAKSKPVSVTGDGDVCKLLKLKFVVVSTVGVVSNAGKLVILKPVSVDWVWACFKRASISILVSVAGVDDS